MQSKSRQVLAWADHSTPRTMNNLYYAICGSDDDEFHLHGFEYDYSLASADALSRLDCDLPYVPRHRRTDGCASIREAGRYRRRPFIEGFDGLRMSSGGPAITFRNEGGFLASFELGGFGRDALQKLPIRPQVQIRVFDMERIFSMRKCIAHFEKFLSGDWEESNLIEKPQQPWRSGPEFGRASMRVPHLYGTADELIAAGSFHAIHTQVGSADPD